jgi:hypothetical protein
VTVRSVIPRPLRRRVAAVVGRYRGAHIRQQLAALAAGGRPIVAGPWLGEVGFEILYWAPFLRWFAAEFGVHRERITILSRGGTASWYGSSAGRYCEIFDFVPPAAFREWHDEHRREIGEQKQTRMTGRERQLLDRVLKYMPGGGDVLHPSVMYELMRPFWWQHLDERWIHRHVAYELLARPNRIAELELPERYIAVKFYFNDCFPATDRNRAFARDVITRLAQRGPVVSLSAGIALDNHGACVVDADGVINIAGAAPSRNLHVQTAVVAHAQEFVGTYGGFAYLAPFYGVRSTSYYDQADGYARSHLHMAQSAFQAIGVGALLHLQPTSDMSPGEWR